MSINLDSEMIVPPIELFSERDYKFLSGKIGNLQCRTPSGWVPLTRKSYEKADLINVPINLYDGHGHSSPGLEKSHIEQLMKHLYVSEPAELRGKTVIAIFNNAGIEGFLLKYAGKREEKQDNDFRQIGTFTVSSN